MPSSLHVPENFYSRVRYPYPHPGWCNAQRWTLCGITIATAVLSLLKKRPFLMRWPMTRELTLSGRVLPVGGIKEKILGCPPGWSEDC